MPNCRFRLLLAAAVGPFLISACASTSAERGATIEKDVTSFERIDAVIDSLRTNHGAENVLVVLDIDNTVMTSEVDLGGDIWYRWQRGRLEVKPSENEVVPCLFEDQIGLLYELGPMRVTEPLVPEKIRKWQNLGHTVFALTSRSPKFRAATERELKRLKIDLTRTALARKGKPAPVLREKGDSEWSYMQGIMMTSGMNKGAMLELILARTSRNFSAIIFVDDSQSHVNDVFERYDGSRRVEVRILHFTKVEAERKRLNGSVLTEDQADKMAEDWNKLNATLNTLFPARVLPSGCLGY